MSQARDGGSRHSGSLEQGGKIKFNREERNSEQESAQQEGFRCRAGNKKERAERKWLCSRTEAQDSKILTFHITATGLEGMDYLRRH